MLDVTAIIPARSGSKRIPLKNIALLNGKPLIAYSIEAWIKSKYYKTPAIVSTDDSRIEGISRFYGAQVIKRPESLSKGDLPSPVPIIKHVIDYLDKYEQRRVQWVIFLQPTSPLRTYKDIDACLDIIANGEGDSLTTVSENSKYESKETGAVYITHSNLINQNRFYGFRLYKYTLDTIDIDTPEDLQEAERILKGEKNDNRGGLHKLEESGRGKGNNQSMQGNQSKRTR